MARVAAVSGLPTAMRWPRVTSRSVFLLLVFAILIFLTAYPLTLLLIDSFHVNNPGEAAVWGLDGWRAAFLDRSVASALGTLLRWARFGLPWQWLWRSCWHG